MICNQCGNEIKTIDGVMTDHLTVKKEWGYHSDKDLLVHEFTLCEQCYDKLVAGFVEPVSVHDITEVV